MLWCREGDGLLGAGDVHIFAGVDMGGTGLALAAEFALRCVEPDAGFLIGFGGVGGNALGEEPDAVFDCMVLLRLTADTDVLLCGQVAGAACSYDGVGGGSGDDAGGAVQLQVRFAVGGDVIAVTLILPLAGLLANDLLTVIQLFDGSLFVSGGVSCAFGLVGVGGLCQGGVELKLAADEGLRLLAVHLHAVVGLLRAADEQTAACSDRSAVPGFKFQAMPCGVLALVVALVGKMAEVEFTVAGVLGLVLLQADAGLVGGVVKHELVVAASAVLAAVQALGLDAGECGCVVVAAVAAGKPAGGIGGGGGGGAGDVVVGGVVLALAVVQAGNYHGAVNVAFNKIDQYFLAGTGQVYAAPVVAGDRGEAGKYAYPGAAGMVAGGAAVITGVGVVEAHLLNNSATCFFNRTFNSFFYRHFCF